MLYPTLSWNENAHCVSLTTCPACLARVPLQSSLDAQWIVVCTQYLTAQLYAQHILELFTDPKLSTKQSSITLEVNMLETAIPPHLRKP